MDPTQTHAYKITEEIDIHDEVTTYLTRSNKNVKERQ